jgi:hypothetical protein
LTSALALFSLPVSSFGQDASKSAKNHHGDLPELEIGKPLPEAFLQQFKNEDLRNWIRDNVKCEMQPAFDPRVDRFGISASHQLLITPKVFKALHASQQVNLLAFELGKVFFVRNVIEADPSQKTTHPYFSELEWQDMAQAEYASVSLRQGESPKLINLTDSDQTSQFGYVFRVELLKIPSGHVDWTSARKQFHAFADPIVRSANMSASLADWFRQTQSIGQQIETIDVMQGRTHRWQALEEWTEHACSYMTQEDVSIYFPEAARKDVGRVKEFHTYLLNNLVVLDDEEITSGLANRGPSLSACQKNLIAVIRSAPAPIDAAWFVQQLDEQRSQYNARLKADADAYERQLRNAKDPIIDMVKTISKVVERGAGKLVDGIKFPFIYAPNASGSGGTYSYVGLGGSGGDRHPTMGPTYVYLKGIAASGGGIPLQ